MTLTRRQFAAALGAGSLALPPLAGAQSEKILKILLGFAAGGAADQVARAVGTGLRASGYAAIIDIRAGAAGRLATEALIGGPSDGSTLLFTPSGNLTLYPHVYQNLRYALKDFEPVGTACEMDFGIAVGSASPARTLAEFLALAKADPRNAAFGTPGAGTVMHFLGVMLGRQANLPLTHVAYKGGAAALTDAIGGVLPCVITTLPNLLPMHEAGKLRILAVSSAEPLAVLPRVPTFAAAGFPELTVSEYFMLLARGGTPPATVSLLNAALNLAVKSPAVAAALEKLQFHPKVMTPEALAARLKSDHAKWAGVVKSSGYTPEA